MNAKQRIKKLEDTKNGAPEKVIVMYDAMNDGELAKFDGVEMTQAEAEVKAAAQPDNVLVIRVTYASLDEAGTQ
jgi:hydroxymethylpyrimidine pyrophosphatase-like HAD family hydrolase